MMKTVKESYKWFKDCHQSVNSGSHAGQFSTAKTYDNMECVLLAINGGRLTMRELADDLGMAKSSVCKILTEDLQMVHMCEKFIPKSLTDKQKNRHIEIA